MIVKLLRMTRGNGDVADLRDNVEALTRYVVDADPWTLALAAREGVRSLSEYLIDARRHGVEPGEKAGHIGTRHLETATLRDWQMEMLAIAHAAPRIEYPILHIIVSWTEGEQPEPNQLDHTVDTLLAVTGLSCCKTIFAEHTNTRNPHLHIAAVRVDPASFRAAGSEWLIQDLHQALAILEERHGWAAEPNALYYARDGAVYDASAPRLTKNLSGRRVVDPASEVMVRTAALEIVGKRDWAGLPPDILERRTDILRARAQARSWDELHQLLDLVGVVYRAKGSGARVHAGEISAKASTVAPTMALKQLEAGWGEFTPHPGDHVPEFEAYRRAHAVQIKQLRDDRAQVQAAIDQWTRSALALVPSWYAARAIRAENNAAQENLDDAYAAAIKRCIDARLNQVDHWREAGSPAEPPPVELPRLFLPPPGAVERPWSVQTGLRAEHDGWHTHYYDSSDRLVFVDHRRVLVVDRPSDHDGLDAALRIAAERWGAVRVNGSAQFKQQSIQRAALLGVSVVDRENRPVVIRTAAPAITGPQAPVSALIRPDHRLDPSRQAVIAQVLADLERMRHVPMRRRANRLEVVVEEDVFDPRPKLRTAALFDEDPAVQAVLERKRATTIAEVERHLLTLSIPLNKKAIIEALPHAGELARAAFMAFEDDDFTSMLRRVHAVHTDRERPCPPAEAGAPSEAVDRNRRRDRLARLGEMFHEGSWDPCDWGREQAAGRAVTRTTTSQIVRRSVPFGMTPPAALDRDSPPAPGRHGQDGNSSSR